MVPDGGNQSLSRQFPPLLTVANKRPDLEHFRVTSTENSIKSMDFFNKHSSPKPLSLCFCPINNNNNNNNINK